MSFLAGLRGRGARSTGAEKAVAARERQAFINGIRAASGYVREVAPMMESREAKALLGELASKLEGMAARAAGAAAGENVGLGRTN